MLNIDVVVTEPLDDTRESDWACDLAYKYAEKTFDGSYDDVNDYASMLLDGCPTLVQLTQGAFVAVLWEWFEDTLHVRVKDVVRGYYEVSGTSFMMCHGVGYDWVDMDLLGGDGSGSARKLFEAFCHDRYGVEFCFTRV